MRGKPLPFFVLAFLSAGLWLGPAIAVRAAEVESPVQDVVASGLNGILGDASVSGRDRVEITRFLDDADADPFAFKKEMDGSAAGDSDDRAEPKFPEAFLERSENAASPQDTEAVLKKLAVLNIVLGQRLLHPNHAKLVKAMHAVRARFSEDKKLQAKVDMDIHEMAKALVLSSGGEEADRGAVSAQSPPERRRRDLPPEARLRKHGRKAVAGEGRPSEPAGVGGEAAGLAGHAP